MCSICSKEYKPQFLNRDTAAPPENDNQVPMVIENNDPKGDSDEKVTPDPDSNATSDSGQESTSNRDNGAPRPNTDTDSNKRALEESDYTRPQEELIFI